MNRSEGSVAEPHVVEKAVSNPSPAKAKLLLNTMRELGASTEQLAFAEKVLTEQSPAPA